MKTDEFKIQENEVEQVQWFTKEDLKNIYNNNPEIFIASMGEIFEEMGVLDI